MKKLIFLAAILLSSCATVTTTRLLPEDEMFLTRKYVGNFVECKHVEPEKFGDPHIILIKTTLDEMHGLISVYSRKCEFTAGERLYVKRTNVATGIWGYWEYIIENSQEKPLFYPISEFQYNERTLVQNWF